MKDLFFFDKMLTPKIIIVFYWFSLLGLVLFGLGVVYSGLVGAVFSNRSLTAEEFVLQVLIFIFGVIFIRIWCEIIIVLFKINEALQGSRYQ